jgi:tellurite resistance protein TerC
MAWIVFNILILVLLAFDLGVFHKKSHTISIKEATLWSIIWIIAALVFNGWIYIAYGQVKAFEFFTGYLIERSLSIDNLFVFLLIFSYFKTPQQYQYKVLFWGILCALIMRIIFILSGVILIQKFHWMIYVFGGLLLYTSIKMLLQKENENNIEKNPFLRLIRKFLPVTNHYENGKFFTLQNLKFYATPLFIVLLMIEISDIIFAVDSIPAIFSITLDPFIIYTSNVFAILGLRAMFFILAGIMSLFKYLKYGLSIILSFVGTKMLLSDVYEIPIALTLIIITLVLSGSILMSVKNKGGHQNNNY